jgi:Ca-activated chloride channel family protein
MKISSDDQKLTAYVLNELEPVERAEVEKALANDPALRHEVEEIKRASAWLTEGLQLQPDWHLTEAEKATALGAAPNKIIPFPWTNTLLKLAALCCIAVFSGALLLSSLGKRTLPEYDSRVGDSGRDRAASETPRDLFAQSEGVPSTPVLPRAEPTAEVDTPVLALEEPHPTVTTAPDSTAQIQLLKQVPSTPSPESESSLSDATAAGEVSVTGAASYSKRRFQTDQNEFNINAFKLAKPSASSGLRQARNRKSSLEWRPQNQPSNSESYAKLNDNSFRRVTDEALSTFSIDVDTASYANVRRMLNEGQLPPPDAVRIEEMVNYFSYNYPAPAGETPFSANVEIASAPWAPKHRLVRIGLKGREIAPQKRPASNLVFLLDVSGSMDQANKLPLVKKGMHLLVDQLNPEDRVAIAVYAGASGLVLNSTACSEKKTIHAAIDHLEAGGSTNGAAGIQLAYQVAKENFLKGGTNRVILCTDGDFNVGITSEGDLTRLIEEKAKSKIFLSVLGFGMGNYKDSTLEKLADKGNGNYAYIDTLREAKKVLVQQMSGALITIAKDVKIQIEFNPTQVQAYRLIGYENRMLAAQDFNDDKKDAGEIGAGHTVTALYEIVPVGVEINLPGIDSLKYQKPRLTDRVAAEVTDLGWADLNIRSLQQQQNDLMSNLEKLKAKGFGEGHPEMQSLQHALSKVTEKLLAAVKSRLLALEGYVQSSTVRIKQMEKEIEVQETREKGEVRIWRESQKLTLQRELLEQAQRDLQMWKTQLEQGREWSGMQSPGSSEMLTLKLRYKAPEGDVSKLLSVPIKDEGKTYAQASNDFKFAAAVASFGMILRDSPYKGDTTLDNVLELAKEGQGTDPQEYRAEFIELVKKAGKLQVRE